MNTDIITNVLMEAAPEAEDTAMSLGERLAFGGQVTVIGLAIIFAVLAILWGLLALFKVFFYDLPAKKKSEETAATITEAPVVEPSATEAQEDDTQLIAVITAAIAAYNSETGASSLPFRVVSYKRLRGANGWSGADENETI